MKKEINPIVIGAVIAVIVVIVVGIFWRANQPSVIENPHVSSPANMMKKPHDP